MLFDAINISASGMTAQSLRMDIIASNIANISTTRTEEGTPYRRQRVIFAPRDYVDLIKIHLPYMKQIFTPIIGKGVRVVAIEEDNSPFKKVYDPQHPDADKEGYVLYPNINPVLEMVDMIDATRAYEANVNVLRNTTQMMLKALEI